MVGFLTFMIYTQLQLLATCCAFPTSCKLAGAPPPPYWPKKGLTTRLGAGDLWAGAQPLSQPIVISLYKKVKVAGIPGRFAALRLLDRYRIITIYENNRYY